MWLYYWLATQGVRPLRDVQSVEIAPTEMSSALAASLLDGFCAGEPWHAVAAAAGAGETWVVSNEIWADHPEKVLATRRDFAALHPNTARALIACTLQACQWLDKSVEHRHEVAALLAEPAFLNQPEALILPRLTGDYGKLTARAGAVRFFAGGEVTYPWLSDGAWFVQQYHRWGFVAAAGEHFAMQVAAQVNQTALYREAAAAVGVNCPVGDVRDRI